MKSRKFNDGRLTVILLTSMLLYGCLKSEIKCSDEASTTVTLSLVRSILAEQIEEEVKQAKPPPDKSKISAFINDITLSLGDVRTTKKDPNSTKSFCVADFNAQFLNNTITDADATRKFLNFPSTIDYVRQNGLKFEANKLVGSLEYSVQPTDDGKKVYSELIKTQLPLVATSEIVTSALLKTNFGINVAQQASQSSSLIAVAKAKGELDIEAAKVEAAKVEAQKIDAATAAASAAKSFADAKTAQRDKENEKTKLDKNQAELESAKLLLKDANDRLNVVWNAATKAQRDGALSNQRIWLKQRDFDCKAKSETAFPTDFTAQEALRLRCEAEVTLPREAELKKAFAVIP